MRNKNKNCINCLDIPAICKGLCNKCYHNDLYHKNKENKLKCNLKWEKTIKGKYSNLKSGSKQRNILCSISFEEYNKIIENSKYLCFYCENDVQNLYGHYLDRINNDIGYTINNVLVCCKRCNMTRSTYWTVEETKIMIKAVMKFKKEST